MQRLANLRAVVLFHRNQFRITGCLALVSYLLAATGSSLLHDHTHVHDEFGRCVAAGRSSGCGHSHRHHHHGHGHTHHHGHAFSSKREEPNDQRGHPATPGPLHDDDCAACQFLAQKPLTAAAAAAVVSVELVAEVTPTYETRPAAEPTPGTRPRGPPACA